MDTVDDVTNFVIRVGHFPRENSRVRGLGIVRPLSYQVQRELAEGSLVCLLEAYEPEPVPVNLVFMPQRGRHGGAVRAFIDHAVPQLRQMLGHPA